jgi:hypothetical protein
MSTTFPALRSSHKRGIALASQNRGKALVEQKFFPSRSLESVASSTLMNNINYEVTYVSPEQEDQRLRNHNTHTKRSGSAWTSTNAPLAQHSKHNTYTGQCNVALLMSFSTFVAIFEVLPYFRKTTFEFFDSTSFYYSQTQSPISET